MTQQNAKSTVNVTNLKMKTKCKIDSKCHKCYVWIFNNENGILLLFSRFADIL